MIIYLGGERKRSEPWQSEANRLWSRTIRTQTLQTVRTQATKTPERMMTDNHLQNLNGFTEHCLVLSCPVMSYAISTQCRNSGARGSSSVAWEATGSA